MALIELSAKKIAVESKSFVKPSDIYEFHLAVGQIRNYQLVHAGWHGGALSARLSNNILGPLKKGQAVDLVKRLGDLLNISVTEEFAYPMIRSQSQMWKRFWPKLRPFKV